ncbi:late competence development ComFB family protein [Carboxydothermus hydrogenoformans]|uniref:Putative ComF operon protein n=1 Tax=Carboxydothermus hydrogenoformans (strain ATCC BAA-161 / DSM 6008 / Z-2901) TaxID=246194 RepID=Q3ACZ4_CARHZ|nr:competence protein ComFB [Carboxydothermus hydrogenoformans]ABB13730.1 putative ComF operon protein [Carboxydothermus hydrogenoformans Z-2901]
MPVLRNYTEEVVDEILQEILPTQDVCKCERCLLDIKAIALNQLPPKYVVTDKGEVITRLNFTKIADRTEVLTAVLRAIDKVKKNPSH